MALENYFPAWNSLSADEQKQLGASAVKRLAQKGTILHNGSADCIGLFIIRSGQLRAFILSDEGREVTLYRLFERDICLFSASCMLNSIQFEISIEAEQDSSLWIIPPDVYKKLMEENAAVANYTNQIMASRFSEVMWLIEQIMWKSLDARLAQFLLEESLLEETDSLKITHERIAAHLGTAREVISRMLKYFEQENIVSLKRGSVILTDKARLNKISK